YIELINWDPQPEIVDNILTWELGDLEAYGSGEITYKVKTLPDSIVFGDKYIGNKVGIYQKDLPQEDADLTNNFDSVLVYIPRQEPPRPKIIALPNIISASDSVEQVIIETFATLYNWEIKVKLADNSFVDLTYVPEVIDRSQLMPGEAVNVGMLKSEHTKKLTTQPEEKIIFQLRGQYIDRTEVGADTFVIVRSSLKFFLDQNVYLPHKDDKIKYHFQISGPTHVKIRVFNIAGELVNTIYDADLNQGARYSEVWDGIDQNGHEIGSGVFIFLLEAEGKIFQRKLAVIR
ncbi:hypothetical protein JW964_15595, partial [candidate division KSB1 bacterium]|nr:hypothetical protein [candidate division KSB1 bacterium]